MGLKIYNTMTRKKEEFIPINPGTVKMYVCGVTVYDMCHIGHARSIVLFDVIFRYLLFKEFKVTYVRNFTDVDDKIIKRAQERGEDWKSLAERYIREFYVDMDALGVLRPTHEPRATDHIDQIKNIISGLMDRGYAYEVDGDVMFSVERFLGYGKLSGKKIEDLVAGARVEVDEKKHNPLDFALWKASKPNEPFWESPWGPGRPGWHIECSAMSMHLLGDHLDIHGGGADLTFPHHENEIAQSEAVAGPQFARYWIHNGFVNIRQEKMSKSLGNVLNIRDILQTVHPEILRLFLLSSHYRSPLDYSDLSIREAGVGLERLYNALAALDAMGEGGVAETLPEELSNLEEKFSDAMDDDFNTPRCLALLFDASRAINRIAADDGSRPEASPNKELLNKVRTDMKHLAGNVLGILKTEPTVFLTQVRNAGTEKLGISIEEIESMIEERAAARKRKDFKRADEMREALSAHGIVLEDGASGTSWKIKDN